MKENPWKKKSSGKTNPWSQRTSTAKSKAPAGKQTRTSRSPSRPVSSTPSGQRILVTEQPMGGSGRPALAGIKLKKAVKVARASFPVGTNVYAEWDTDPAYSIKPGELQTFSGVVTEIDDKAWITVINEASRVKLWIPLNRVRLRVLPATQSA